MSAPAILIADDDPAILTALSTRCRKMGFAVDTATNGLQMLLKARRSSPDLIIVDINMPKLDGLTASYHLLEPGGLSADVIVVTGTPSDETLQHCEAMGLFYACKREQFWQGICQALTEIFPHMAEVIVEEIGPLAASPDAVPSSPRVLVVDDDEQVAQFLASRLKKLGIEVLYAPNAARAQRLAATHYPSVVVTDYFMPEGDAEFLIMRLRSARATAQMPVIVISGRDLDEATAKQLKREMLGCPGAARIFKKSFDVSELFEAIQQYCSAEPSSAVKL
jgi:CheY-like chemotaxis protein